MHDMRARRVRNRMKIYNFLRKSNNREIKMRENKIFDVGDVDCSAEGCFNCDPLI